MTLMNREITKDKITISIDKELHNELKQHCDKNLIKLSTYIEHLLKEAKKREK